MGTTMPMASCLPAHGRVPCSACHQGPVRFDDTRQQGDGWRITANPLAWGSTRPEVLVLGFSKEPTQAGALAQTPHDEVAFKGARKRAYQILAHLGTVPPSPDPARAMDRLIADRHGRLAFGSLVRCTVERWDRKAGRWSGTGGGMLDKFVATPFGATVTARCASTFLGNLPSETKLVVLYGMGSKLGYIDEAERLIRRARLAQGTSGWRRHDQVGYGDDRVTFVHAEHFRAQGSLIGDWLNERQKSGKSPNRERAELGQLAAAAARQALGRAGQQPRPRRPPHHPTDIPCRTSCRPWVTPFP